MSVGWRGGSNSSTLLANKTTAAVVSSSCSSGMLLIGRLLHLPYCSSASLFSLSWRTSWFRASIFLSRFARLALRARISPLRSSMRLTSSWLAVFRTLASFLVTSSSLRALVRERMKAALSSSWWAADRLDPLLPFLDLTGYHSGMLVPGWAGGTAQWAMPGAIFSSQTHRQRESFSLIKSILSDLWQRKSHFWYTIQWCFTQQCSKLQVPMWPIHGIRKEATPCSFHHAHASWRPGYLNRWSR